MGIQLDRADAANGQLWFLPGSHRHGGPLGDPWAGDHPIVAIDAEPGDVTVHYGHVLHAAPAPSAPDAGRRAVYVGFSRPELFEAIPAGPGLQRRDLRRRRRPRAQRGRAVDRLTSVAQASGAPVAHASVASGASIALGPAVPSRLALMRSWTRHPSGVRTQCQVLADTRATQNRSCSASQRMLRA